MIVGILYRESKAFFETEINPEPSPFAANMSLDDPAVVKTLQRWWWRAFVCFVFSNTEVCSPTWGCIYKNSRFTGKYTEGVHVCGWTSALVTSVIQQKKKPDISPTALFTAVYLIVTQWHSSSWATNLLTNTNQTATSRTSWRLCLPAISCRRSCEWRQLLALLVL